MEITVPSYLELDQVQLQNNLYVCMHVFVYGWLFVCFMK
jgi:hypothetical protein